MKRKRHRQKYDYEAAAKRLKYTWELLERNAFFGNPAVAQVQDSVVYTSESLDGAAQRFGLDVPPTLYFDNIESRRELKPKEQHSDWGRRLDAHGKRGSLDVAYRIEDCQGRGGWHHYHLGCSGPGPHSDGGFSMHVIEDRSYYYGVRSLEKLTEWFNKWDRKDAREKGLTVAVLYIGDADPVQGQEQVLFRREKARVLERLDPLTFQRVHDPHLPLDLPHWRAGPDYRLDPEPEPELDDWDN